jgi:hypothetical protein
MKISVLALLILPFVSGMAILPAPLDISGVQQIAQQAEKLGNVVRNVDMAKNIVQQQAETVKNTIQGTVKSTIQQQAETAKGTVNKQVEKAMRTVNNIAEPALKKPMMVRSKTLKKYCLQYPRKCFGVGTQ